MCVSHLDSVDKLFHDGAESCDASLLVSNGEGRVCGGRVERQWWELGRGDGYLLTSSEIF